MPAKEANLKIPQVIIPRVVTSVFKISVSISRLLSSSTKQDSTGMIAMREETKTLFLLPSMMTFILVSDDFDKLFKLYEQFM